MAAFLAGQRMTENIRLGCAEQARQLACGFPVNVVVGHLHGLFLVLEPPRWAALEKSKGPTGNGRIAWQAQRLWSRRLRLARTFPGGPDFINQATSGPVPKAGEPWAGLTDFTGKWQNAEPHGPFSRNKEIHIVYAFVL